MTPKRRILELPDGNWRQRLAGEPVENGDYYRYRTNWFNLIWDDAWAGYKVGHDERLLDVWTPCESATKRGRWGERIAEKVRADRRRRLTAVEYDDMTDEQKAIVDAVHEPTLRVPSGLEKDELIKWLRETFEGR